VWPIVGVLALAILQTGSRGALLALAAGLMTFGFGARTLGLKLRNACAVALALGLLTWATYNTDVMRNRLLRSAEKGTLAGRERIYPALWQMFLEKPLVGWGPIANKYELGSRPGQTRVRRDAHNVGLEVLTASGLLGAIPFLSGLGMCFAAAWRARRGSRGSLPLALATAVLVGSMSMNWIAALPFWLVLAYSTASGAPMPASVAAVAPRYRALSAVRRGVA
jgi:O-antigen ligase